MNASVLQFAGARERIAAAIGADPLARVGRCRNGCGRPHAPGPKRLCEECRTENRRESVRRYRRGAVA